MDLDVAVSGADQDRARAEARRLAGAKPDFLLSFGFAAGLTLGLPAGTAVLAHTIVAETGERWDVDAKWRERLASALAMPLVGGGIAALDRAVETSAAKRRVAAATGAVAADMESGVLARVASARNIPLVVLRVVCDPVDRRLPRAFLELVDYKGRLRPARLPSILPHLGTALPLAIESARAGRRLKYAAGRLGQVEVRPRARPCNS